MTHRVDRSLLLEHDPAKLGVLTIASLRDADWRHQSEAMKRGYSSMAEWAIDELLVMVREMQERLDRLERAEVFGMSLADRAAHAAGELEP